MSKFLSCDWGTSSFRLRLIETPTFAILAEKVSDQGIAQTFKLWSQIAKTEEARLSFYLDFINTHIQDFQGLGYSMKGVPLVISGMVASTMGMIELPYIDFPFPVDGTGMITKLFHGKSAFSDNVLIISGARTNNDVMRGEETQLIGCFDENNAPGRKIFVFPGTHSKHVEVDRNIATSLQTYMTGEFFDLLSNQSTLSAGVQKGPGLLQEKNVESYKKGIEDSLSSQILHSSFRVRTNVLFKKYNKEENYYYLSGLLIGTELKELTGVDHKKIVLVASGLLRPCYEMAFGVLNKQSALEIIDADQALIRGQFRILQQLQLI